ncbi:MAG TPA: sigma-70 family RNA polymerase sigma factor [Roseiflexaceae bacterium]|nr:sigma-70 family RNA polymerase sigma factor [Roseiflexaceae bacterium]
MRIIYNAAAREQPALQTKDSRSVDQIATSAADLTTLRDDALLALIARRHDAALGVLYDRYVRLVYTVALRITGDRQTAEEVVQDVFQNVWQAAPSFQSGLGSVPSWLMGITRHRAIDATRSKRERARTREQTLDQDWDMGSDHNPEDEVVLRLQRETVRAALSELPTAQRQAIELAYYGGLTRNEIAAELGEPVGTIKTRLRLGLLKLRDLLRPNQE